MTESIITISIVGLVTGFIFSMPIAGPISILITTNAFKGKLRYCNLVSIGSSLGTMTYAFLAVFGLSKLYRLYQPLIPYLLSIGSILLVCLGYRIFITKYDIEHLEEKNQLNEKIGKKHIGGFYTGLVINFLNPTLFIGWLTSTFLVISFVTSLGFDTGGLNNFVEESVKEIGSIENSTANHSSVLVRHITEAETRSPKNFHLVISAFYAFFVAAGSVTWFYILALSITRFRRYINYKYISAFIKFMGIVLCFIGLYFAYLAASHHSI